MGKAEREGAKRLHQASQDIRQAMKKTWNLAPKAPMFTRKSNPKKEKGKRVVTRTNRLIGNHAFKILASGAAQHAARVIAHEASVLRIDVGTESTRCPWMTRFSRGACAMLTGFACAYAQEAHRNAVNIRKGLGTWKTKPDGEKEFVGQKRLNGKLMKMGYDAADDAIFASCRVVPRHVVICKLEKPISGKTRPGKEGESQNNLDSEYTPPAENEDAEGVAGDESGKGK